MSQAAFRDQIVQLTAGGAHRPTVSNGRALIPYLLPAGRIEFTR